MTFTRFTASSGLVAAIGKQHTVAPGIEISQVEGINADNQTANQFLFGKKRYEGVWCPVDNLINVVDETGGRVMADFTTIREAPVGYIVAKPEVGVYFSTKVQTPRSAGEGVGHFVGPIGD